MPQLWHAGLMRSPYPAADPKLAMVNHHMKSMGPSGLYMPGLLDPAVTPPDPVEVAEPMTTDEIDACIASYAMGARTAMEIGCDGINIHGRSEEHTSELQSLMRTSYAVFCLTKKKHHIKTLYRQPTNI